MVTGVRGDQGQRREHRVLLDAVADGVEPGPE